MSALVESGEAIAGYTENIFALAGRADAEYEFARAVGRHAMAVWDRGDPGLAYAAAETALDMFEIAEDQATPNSAHAAFYSEFSTELRRRVTADRSRESFRPDSRMIRAPR